MTQAAGLKNLAGALNKAQSELGAVKKGSDNPFYKSKYADINAVIETVKDVLNSNGITYLQPVNVALMGDQVIDVVDTILMHSSGEIITSRTRVVSGNNSDAQKFGAAVTYARRFALQSIIGLPAEDDDGNTATGKKVTAKDMKKPETKKETKTTKPTETVKNSNWA